MSVVVTEESQSLGSSLPYRLRPNKAVDRSLFLSLLSWLSPHLGLKNYPYIGMGAEFLEDFRLMHTRIGTIEMISVEMSPEVLKRQEFNRPLESIKCVPGTIEDYFSSTTIDKPSIVWLDYTEFNSLKLQIETFLEVLRDIPVGSIVRVTLNANSANLSSPGPEETKVNIKKSDVFLQEWRLSKLRSILGSMVPHSLELPLMVGKRFGEALLKVLQNSVDEQFAHSSDRSVNWALTTHYADGQPMITATAIITECNDTITTELINKWEFSSTPDTPLKLDLPSLSTKERIYLESKIQSTTQIEYKLPRGKLGQDPVDCFKKFYRVFPHFGGVDL